MFGQFQVVAAGSLLYLVLALTSICVPSAHALTTISPDDYEVTEVYTEVVAITTEQAEGGDEKPGYSGGSDTYMTLKFTIKNRDLSDEKRVSEEIQNEVSALCRQRFQDFDSVIILDLRAGSVIAELAIKFKRDLEDKDRTVLLQTFYEAVEINGTIGNLQVSQLFAETKSGKQDSNMYHRIEDACDITQCIHDKMACSSEGVVCFSTCEDNKDFCQNNSTCVDNTSGANFLKCNCVDDYQGDQCEIPPRPRSRPYSENVFIGIIVAAAIVLFLLLLLLACLLCSRIRKRKAEYRSDIYPVDNVISLEMSNDYFIAGGVGTQTEDSFLMTQYMLNGIPPKPGFSHSVMQTTDSFLLAKSQGRLPHKRGKTAPAPNAPNHTKNSTDSEKSRDKAVDVVDIPSEKKQQQQQQQPKEEVKVQAEVDSGIDDKGAVNEGFVKDEDIGASKQAKENDEELKDPKKIVKV